jgi:hypothetical protein
MQRTMDVAQQISLLEGFDQVADRPGFERLDACAFVGEGGNEDDRDLMAPATRSLCNSSPLRPGICTSNTRQAV